jgi:hypothetical protein
MVQRDLFIGALWLFSVAAAGYLAASSSVSAQVASAEGRFGRIALASGFEPDPSVIAVRAGGSMAAAELAAGCDGYIRRGEPDFALSYSSGRFVLAIWVESEADTTLVVRAPDGDWVCNDDFNEVGGLNPAIVFDPSQSGGYEIWVGGVANKEFDDAELHISEKLPFPGSSVAASSESNDRGDDAGEYALDGECDDPRYGGDFESHRRHDATDCAGAALVETSGLGDDAGEYALDGECDDPRYGGDFESHRRHDATDCAGASGLDDDAGEYALDGECDDPRFGGVLENHRGHDATDCVDANIADDDFGNDTGEYASDGECDDPRFGGTLASHRGRDATDCSALGTVASSDDAPVGDRTPPEIEIVSDISTDNGVAEIRGRARDNTRLRSVLVDDRPVPFDADGQFKVLRPVEVGTHEIVVAATDADGNTTQSIVTVQSVDATAPLIETTRRLETTEVRVRIEGFVTDASKIALLTVAGRPVPSTEKTFGLDVSVAVGDSTVLIVAVDEWGNRSEQAVTILRSETRVAKITPGVKAKIEPAIATMPTGPRTALVIGNSSYTDSPLRNPANDAALIAQALRDTGFEVIELIDATDREMRHAIVEFGDFLSGGGVGLFYYAGHGMQVGGENYLIPLGASITREAHVAIEGISVNQVLARMDGAKNPMNIVILDACRNNPFARSFRSNVSGLAQMQAPVGTYIAYATAPGDVAADGEGAHSPFSEALASAMQLPGISLEDTFKVVRRSVQQQTSGRQVPWSATNVVADFAFRPEVSRSQN